MKKLKSRKFWITVAAFIASISGSIVGLNTDNDVLATVGFILATLSAAIYAALEASIDKAAITKSSESTTTIVKE